MEDQRQKYFGWQVWPMNTDRPRLLAARQPSKLAGFKRGTSRSNLRVAFHKDYSHRSLTQYVDRPQSAVKTQIQVVPSPCAMKLSIHGAGHPRRALMRPIRLA